MPQAATANSTILPRRTLLRVLGGIPLIGPASCVLAEPAIAIPVQPEPVTNWMLDQYETFLAIEQTALARERRGEPRSMCCTYGPAWDWGSNDPGPASRRAAAMLGLAGIDWRAK